MKKVSYKNLSYYLFLLILIFAYWNTPNNFFWRDEWVFLANVKNQNFNVFAPHVGHIFPIFKAFYWAELNIFGTVSILYLYTNLFLHFIICAVLFFFLKEKNQINNTLAIILTGIIAVHPVNFNTLLWTFQSCQLLQVLFQFLSVIFFISFIENQKKQNLLLSVIFLIVQNYCFGNGLLMPIPLMLGALFIKNKTLKHQSLLLLSIVFLLFLLVQFTWGLSGVSFSFTESVKTFLYFNSVNLFRYLFIKNIEALNQYIVLFLIFPFILLIIKMKTVSQNHKLLIYLAWYVCVSILIPVARNSIYLTDFAAYFSFPAFLPFSLFVIELFKTDLIKIYENRRLSSLLIILISIVSLIFFLVDRRMVATFSNRNYNNEQNLTKAIIQNTNYVPFDDPLFQPPWNEISDPQGVYLFWKQKNKLNFLLPASAANYNNVNR